MNFERFQVFLVIAAWLSRTRNGTNGIVQRYYRLLDPSSCLSPCSGFQVYTVYSRHDIPRNRYRVQASRNAYCLLDGYLAIAMIG